MAHFASAALAILLDLARSLDSMMDFKESERTTESGKHVVEEMKSVASLFASVLRLAAEEADAHRNDDDGVDATNGSTSTNYAVARQRLIEAILRLSPIVERSSVLISTIDGKDSTQASITVGTTPQKLANALLPTYFPQCHLITYLACIFTGMVDVLADSVPSRVGNGDGEEKRLSVVEEVALSMMNADDADEAVRSSGLSAWASQIATEAGIPTMASLAYGTPDLSSLVNSLDAYETLISDVYGVGEVGGKDDRWFLEDVLQRSLNR